MLSRKLIILSLLSVCISVYLRFHSLQNMNGKLLIVLIILYIVTGFSAYRLFITGELLRGRISQASRMRIFILLLYSLALGLSMLCGYFDKLSVGHKVNVDSLGQFLSFGSVICALSVISFLLPFEKEEWRVPNIVIVFLLPPLFGAIFRHQISAPTLLSNSLWLTVASVVLMISLLMGKHD